MAILSASSVHVIQQSPLHHERSDSPTDITDDESWDCCHDCSDEHEQSVVPTCNACPCCADRCGDEHCGSCGTTKSLKRYSSGVARFGAPDDEVYYTMCQLRRHDHADSAWLLVGDTIYDSTDYIAKHPGGMTSILKKAGGKVDCIVDFEFHSKKARKLWKQYKVGKISQCPSESQQTNFGTNEQCAIS
eukprot:CAMPEP_0119006652 /NCGR_PEP_ID=MMETSP1176-20130426/2439_1 /TAXON_ID=265551 /ORGANISM="Synedropsis recta cf, Strain CCMP1620" /LENGTH=188 /DNA_ID=CAMNT_0006958603 /DNA_START=110 /DNA_END=676 /DNA_ORIENTATION=+